MEINKNAPLENLKRGIKEYNKGLLLLQDDDNKSIDSKINIIDAYFDVLNSLQQIVNLCYKKAVIMNNVAKDNKEVKDLCLAIKQFKEDDYAKEILRLRSSISRLKTSRLPKDIENYKLKCIIDEKTPLFKKIIKCLEVVYESVKRENILLLNTPKQVEAKNEDKKPTGRKKGLQIPLSEIINKDKKEVWDKKKAKFIERFKEYEGQKLALLVEVLENKGFIKNDYQKKEIFTSMFIEFGKEYSPNKNKSFNEYYNKRKPQFEDAYTDVEIDFEEIF